MKISSSEHPFFFTFLVIFQPVQGAKASQGRWLVNGENAGYKDMYDR